MPSGSYPPVPTPSADFLIYGLTTIVWGTDGRYASYIVTSCNDAERNEKILIENGTGFEAVVILLLKGHTLQIEVVDDTAVTPPATGDIVTLSTPYGAVNMLKEEDSSTEARKREGMRTFSFSSYNAITGLS